MSRLLAPAIAGLLGLSGSLGATLFLYASATASLDRELAERLRGAGRTASRMLARTAIDDGDLRAIMIANDLEGVYVLERSLAVLADANGSAGARADLLRVDGARVERAFGGEASVAFSYTVGNVPVATGYFPIRSRQGAIESVIVLEAGAAFTSAPASLRHALWIGMALSALGALTLAAVAMQWSRGEQRRQETATRAARGDALARMAAMIAHEVRNPLGVIRAAVELVRRRSGPAIAEADREALMDVLDEVERLRRLTQDFLDLAREPSFSTTAMDLTPVALEVARGIERTHSSVAVQVDAPPLPIQGDPGRLRQVLANLLLNAAEAGARNVRLTGTAADGFARVEIADDGPGVPASLRHRLFEPFASGRVGGTGLGLAISRRIVERHGGALALSPESPGGTTFVLRLPLAAQ